MYDLEVRETVAEERAAEAGEAERRANQRRRAPKSRGEIQEKGGQDNP
jgi:hypothetical protein